MRESPLPPASAPSCSPRRRLAWRVLVGRWAALGLALVVSAAPETRAQGLGGDWSGARTALAEAGVEPTLVLALEGVANLEGGLSPGAAALGRARGGLTLDLDALLGWTGGRLRATALATFGDRPSASLVGDVQVISNIEAPTALRPFELWLEQALGPVSLRAGLLALDTELGLVPAGAVFLHSSPGTSAAFGISGANGPGIYPITGLGVRMDLALPEHLRLRVAVLEGVPGDPRRPQAVGLGLDPREGALIVSELVFDDIASAPGTRAVLGGYAYTENPAESPEAPGGGPLGLYVLLQRDLLREGERWLAAWTQLDVAESEANPIDLAFGAGLSGRGLLPARPADEAGVMLALARLGWRSEHPGALELALELVYRLQLLPGLSLRPALQYIVNPGGAPGRGDALVVLGRLSAAL